MCLLPASQSPKVTALLSPRPLPDSCCALVWDGVETSFTAERLTQHSLFPSLPRERLTAQLWDKLCYKGMLKLLRRGIWDTRCDLRAAHVFPHQIKGEHMQTCFFMFLIFQALSFLALGEGPAALGGGGGGVGWLPMQLPPLFFPGLGARGNT